MPPTRSTLLVAFLAARLAHAAEPIVAGPDARTALRLTVYSQDAYAVVRDVRSVTLPAGDGELRFGGVPEQVDARSVSLRPADGKALRVREQRFRHDPPTSILARWLGKPVELVETDEQLRTQTSNVELLAIGATNLYRAGDRILIGHPGRLQLPPLGEELFVEPVLSWTLAAAATGQRELEARYAMTGIAWEADYELSLAEPRWPTDATLTGWISIRNDTRMSFARASLALVAGRMHRAARPEPAMERMFAKGLQAADVAVAEPAEEAVLDYHRYELPDPVALAPWEAKQLHLLAAEGVRVERRYRVSGPGLWANAPAGEDEQSLPVHIRLSFRNDAKRGPVRPLPAGVVRVHAPTPSGAIELVGEDRIGHVPTGERVDLRVGEASDLVAKRRQTDYRQTGTKPYTAELAAVTTVRNHSDAAATIDVREPVPGSWKVLESSHEAERVNATTLGFTVTVPAGGTTDVRYRVQLGP